MFNLSIENLHLLNIFFFKASVLFTTPSLALDAVNKLHAHVYKGSLLSVTLKKRIDTFARPIIPIEKSSTNPTEPQRRVLAPAPSPASRLIVRNIPFNATEQDLRAIFLPYGPIYSIQIPTDDKPTKEDDHNAGPTLAKKVRIKGFAFVWMLSKKDAERAIEGCNGITVRAGIAETLVSDKQKKKKLKRIEKKLKEAGRKATDKEEAEADEDMEVEPTDDKRATERVIAVGWALSKEKWKAEKVKMEDANATIHELAEPQDDNSNTDSDIDSDDEGHLGVHNGEDDNSADTDSEQEEEENDEERVKPQLPPPEAGTTLFIRNIPFNATEDELRLL